MDRSRPNGFRQNVADAGNAASIIGVKAASQLYGVPTSTIHNYMLRNNIPKQVPERDIEINMKLSVLCSVAARECPNTPMSLAAIADVLGISKQAVAAIEFKALKKLRNHPQIKSMIHHLKR